MDWELNKMWIRENRIANVELKIVITNLNKYTFLILTPEFGF